jgi:hypothetical protein
MNKVLELKGKFSHAPNSSRPGPAALPKDATVGTNDVERLLNSLETVFRYWTEKESPFKPLVSVHYKDIVAKSNRMGAILAVGSKSPNATIVGAKFSSDAKPKHIITHCVDTSTFTSGVEKLEKAMTILQEDFDSIMTAHQMDVLNNNQQRLKHPLSEIEMHRKERMEKAIAAHGLSRTVFCQLLKDVCYIDRFAVEERTELLTENQIVTLYDTGLKKDEIIKRLRMEDEYIRTIDDVTWMVTPKQYRRIIDAAPYLVSMSVADLGKIDAPPVVRNGISDGFSIPAPQNEPVIGVIDTLFDMHAYFSAWVDYTCMVNEDLITDDDYSHGTAVASLIVDGPSLNPHLDDGCGRFRVRHFGVAKHGTNSTTQLIKTIRSIVETNRDIKVWNLSLGSPLEVDENFISPEGTLLDTLQYQYDVIFVVAGTNNRDRAVDRPRIGAPADSLNSLVVNAVSLAGIPVEYARKGPVLHFFNKPDVAVFGGDRQDGMIVYSSHGRVKESGTSFAAPWIARKLAYLIQVLGFSREAAKALLLDAAAGWNTDVPQQELVGFGIVPTRIEDILNTPNGEIKFVVQGVAEAYETYAYSLPVPINKEQFPYLAKATLCYFPKCSRSQGVDYTDTELDLHFGRIDQKGAIKPIDDNMQDDDSPGRTLFEKDVRAQYRKWDNVKHLCEQIRDKNRPRKRLNSANPNWGISIKAKERLETKSGLGMQFAIVVTLREIYGVNRIAQFMQLCRANSWFVDEVDIHNRVEAYEKAEEEVIFDE